MSDINNTNISEASSTQPTSVVHDDWSHLNNLSIPSNNTHMQVTQKKKSVFFWFFIFGIVALVVAGAFAYYQYEFNKNEVSSDKIVVTADLKENVRGGESNVVNLTINNGNSVAIKDAKVTVSYQRGFTRQGESDKVTEYFMLGDVVPSMYYSTSTVVTFIGEEGESRKFKVDLSYKVAGSNAEFVKSFEVSTKISTPSVSLKIDSSDNVLEENEITYTFRVKNLSLDNFARSMLVIETPTAFLIKKVEGVDDQKKYVIENLKVGEEKAYSITGYYKDSVGMSKVMRAYVAVLNDKNEIGSSYAEDVREITVDNYPLSYNVKFKNNNTESTYLELNSDSVLEMTINNSSPDAVNDVNLILENTTTKEKINITSSDNSILSKVTPTEQAVITIPLKSSSVGDYNYKIEIYGVQRGKFNSAILGKGEIVVPFRQGRGY